MPPGKGGGEMASLPSPQVQTLFSPSGTCFPVLRFLASSTASHYTVPHCKLAGNGELPEDEAVPAFILPH